MEVIMKPFIRIALFGIVVSLLLSCASGTQTPTATQLQPTVTVSPTITISPTPSPTERPKLAIDGMLILPTMGPYIDSTPMPLATPSLNGSTAKLLDLSEAEALELIRQMNESSYQNYPPQPDWFSEGKFIGSQAPVGLAIQEYLYRFPDSPNAERLRWQLAFINSISLYGLAGDQDSDKWILAELQNRLNQGETTPDQLEKIVGQYWFDVTYLQPIENLFQDGKTGWLYEITPQVWEEDIASTLQGYSFHGSLFFVVREIKGNDFQISLLNSSWNFSSGVNSVFEVSDHNQNGIPEIALSIGAHSGTMCNGELLIYEWNKNEFRELTGGKVHIGDCSDNYEYQIDGNGNPSIFLSKMFYPRELLFVWDGKTYRPEPVLSTNDLVENWGNSAFFSADEARAIEAILSSNDQKDLTPAHLDFLRFRLGLVYALNSKVEKAKTILQDLADNPLDSSLTIYSGFAKNFLKYYSGDSSLYVACEQSRKIMDNTDWYSEESEKVYGIIFDAFSPFGPGLLRCFSKDVFELYIHNFSISVEDVPGELRKNGVIVYYAEKQDLNLDGITNEWLIAFDGGVYAVFPSGHKYETVNLEYIWYGQPTSKYLAMTAKVERWKGVQEPVLIISTEQELLMIGIGAGYTPAWNSDEIRVEDVTYYPNDDPSQYQVFYSKPASKDDYFVEPWIGYRWDGDHRKFQDDLLEYTLFIAHDPIKAAAMADEITPLVLNWEDLNYWTLPRYLYLCGLSYELAGDKQSAAQVYWQLWHDFPESQYALIAKYKLEPVAP